MNIKIWIIMLVFVGSILIIAPGAETPGECENLGKFPESQSPVTRLNFFIPKVGDYGIFIYDMKGALLRTVLKRRLEKGKYSIPWDGKDDHGVRVRPDVYFIVIKDIIKDKPIMTGKFLLLE